MKIKSYYLVLALAVGILCVSGLGQRELRSPEPALIGQANPALAGVTKLYVVIESSEPGAGKGGLIWKDLEQKIKERLEAAGIEIAPGVSLGSGERAHDIPELRVHMDLLEFTDSQIYVFRIQVVFATKVYLKEKGVFFKAEAWGAGPVMQAVPAPSMPDTVTQTILEQVEAFIYAHLAANPSAKQPSQANDVNAASLTAQVRDAKPAADQQVAQYKYVASKNSRVFHSRQCSWAQRIKPENLIGYNSRQQAIEAGKRPCKRCKP